MGLNVEKEVALMGRMTVRELQEKFTEVFGERPRGRNKRWLAKRIIWRMQANQEGGLSERALRRAAELANDADLRLTAPQTTGGKPSISPKLTDRKSWDSRLPMPGTAITREYKGQTYEVIVDTDGFQFEGERYKSLSAVAKAITGSHWNGFHFFGLEHKNKDV